MAQKPAWTKEDKAALKRLVDRYGAAEVMEAARPKKSGFLARVEVLAWPPTLPDHIERLSAELLEDARKIEDHRYSRRGMRGKDGVEMSLQEIKLTALIMLASCVEKLILPPRPLVDLIAYLTSAMTSADLWPSYEDLKRRRLTDKQVVALHYEFLNPGSSSNAVARAVGVTNKTIDAWRKEGAYSRTLRLYPAPTATAIRERRLSRKLGKSISTAPKQRGNK